MAHILKRRSRSNHDFIFGQYANHEQDTRADNLKIIFSKKFGRKTKNDDLRHFNSVSFSSAAAAVEVLAVVVVAAVVDDGCLTGVGGMEVSVRCCPDSSSLALAPDNEYLTDTTLTDLLTLTSEVSGSSSVLVET